MPFGQPVRDDIFRTLGHQRLTVKDLAQVSRTEHRLFAVIQFHFKGLAGVSLRGCEDAQSRGMIPAVSIHIHMAVKALPDAEREAFCFPAREQFAVHVQHPDGQRGGLVVVVVESDLVGSRGQHDRLEELRGVKSLDFRREFINDCLVTGNGMHRRFPDGRVVLRPQITDRVGQGFRRFDVAENQHILVRVLCHGQAAFSLFGQPAGDADGLFRDDLTHFSAGDGLLRVQRRTAFGGQIADGVGMGIFREVRIKRHIFRDPCGEIPALSARCVPAGEAVEGFHRVGRLCGSCAVWDADRLRAVIRDKGDLRILPHGIKREVVARHFGRGFCTGFGMPADQFAAGIFNGIVRRDAGSEPYRVTGIKVFRPVIVFDHIGLAVIVEIIGVVRKAVFSFNMRVAGERFWIQRAAGVNRLTQFIGFDVFPFGILQPVIHRFRTRVFGPPGGIIGFFKHICGEGDTFGEIVVPAIEIIIRTGDFRRPFGRDRFTETGLKGIVFQFPTVHFDHGIFSIKVKAEFVGAEFVVYRQDRAAFSIDNNGRSGVHFLIRFIAFIIFCEDGIIDRNGCPGLACHLLRFRIFIVHFRTGEHFLIINDTVMRIRRLPFRRNGPVFCQRDCRHRAAVFIQPAAEAVTLPGRFIGFKFHRLPIKDFGTRQRLTAVGIKGEKNVFPLVKGIHSLSGLREFFVFHADQGPICGFSRGADLRAHMAGEVGSFHLLVAGSVHGRHGFDQGIAEVRGIVVHGDVQRVPG